MDPGVRARCEPSCDDFAPLLRRVGVRCGNVHTVGGSSVGALLEVQGVEKSFGLLRAVDGLSLEARAGEVLAVLGPNGAGKTTLLRMIIGMLRPDRGELRYHLDGSTTPRPDPRLLGYLPEERGLYLDVPVKRMLLYFAALRGVPAAKAKVEADRWLERFDLGDRGDAEIRDLSKGNQQKIQFISAILHRPPLAILDEPFSGLDPLNQAFFLELIRELAGQGTAVILSAHQMQLVERLADRILLVRGGRQVGAGTVAELRGRWGTGRRLRVKVAGEPEPATLAGLPAVREVALDGSDGMQLLLEPEAPLSALLREIGSRVEVLDLQAESVTLHDIYLQTVGGGGGDPGANAPGDPGEQIAPSNPGGTP
jgi:ABC-2 type transport system ATP-binding protein